MSVAHQPLAAVIGALVGMAAEPGRNLGLDSMRQQCSRTVTQYLGQRICKSSWLGELENVSVGHGVSLLRWRSGGVKHPHDTPPYPFMPSPTFAYSSPMTWIMHNRPSIWRRCYCSQWASIHLSQPRKLRGRSQRMTHLSRHLSGSKRTDLLTSKSADERDMIAT